MLVRASQRVPFIIVSTILDIPNISWAKRAYNQRYDFRYIACKLQLTKVVIEHVDGGAA